MVTQPKPLFGSKRKDLEGQVLQQTGLFDRLIDPLVQITGRTGKIKWANKAAHELLGPNIIGRRFNQVFISNELAPALQRLKKQEGREFEQILRPKNLAGREFRVRLVRLEKKTIYGAKILLSISDVTELMRLQTQRSDFIANASHELKTPIAALSGFIETLEHDPEALPVFLPSMLKETKRMRELISSLLDLTKTEMQASKPPDTFIDLMPIIAQSIESMSFELTQRKQEVYIEPFDRLCFVRADQEAISTVFTNLLHNAAKYSPNGSTIRIVPRFESNHLLIAVEDEGIGISAKHIPRLTERFYRAEGSRASEKGGTGLGLAIVKHILIRHNAHLTIKSKVGKGSSFTVVFPCRNSAL